MLPQYLKIEGRPFERLLPINVKLDENSCRELTSNMSPILTNVQIANVAYKCHPLIRALFRTKYFPRHTTI